MFIEFITAFEQLAIHTNGLVDPFYKECFISGVKEAIQAHVWGNHPLNWLEACQRALEAETILNAQHPRSSFTPKSKSATIGSSTQPFKI